MRVLIVDDEARKRNELRVAVSEASGGAAQIEIATNVHDAERKLQEAVFDLMLLDLYLPLRARQPPQREGGLELLRRIRQGAHARRIVAPRCVLAVTAYEDVRAAQKQLFQDEAMVLVPYAAGSTDWRKAIHSQVQQVAAALADVKHLCSLCIVTALHKVELEAVLDLPGEWQPVRLDNDPTQYFRGTFAREGRSLTVVAAAATEMGMPAAAALAMKMVFRFRPRVLAMAGIAAGFRGEFGDILVAYDSWDYGSGKWLVQDDQSLFRPRPNYLPIDIDLKNRLEVFSMSHVSVLEDIRAEWPGDAPPEAPRVHAGPLASGASVVADRAIVDQIREHNDKLIGVEMEGYGVFAACRAADLPRPSALVIKSICDFGTPEKDDQYQRYAAYTSARYLYRFALGNLWG